MKYYTQNTHVLLIEADPGIQESFSMMFNDQLTCQYLDNCDGIIEELNNETIDIILCNFELQEKCDFRNLKSIRDSFPGIPVILYSSGIEAPMVREAFLNGASDFFPENLPDSVPGDELLGFINRCMEKHEKPGSVKKKTLDIAVKDNPFGDQQDNHQNRAVLFERVLDDLNIWFCMTDTKGNVTVWGKGAERLSGYRREQVLRNENIWKILDIETDFQGKVFSSDSMVTYNGITNFETGIQTIDGRKKYIKWLCRAVTDAHGNTTGFIFAGKDITETRKLKRHIKRLNQELNDIIYMVSHDFRGPLSMIDAYTSEICKDPSLSGMYGEKIIQQSFCLMRFIEELLKLSRSANPVRDQIKIDLEILVKKLSLSILPKNIETRLEIETELPDIYGDFLRIEEVFHNLIENSINFRDPAKDTLLIKIGAKYFNGNPVIYIKDNGRGIKKEHLDKIFNMGFSAGRNHSRGLGLSIAKRIINIHGGKITAKSAGENKGAEFYIELPARCKEEVPVKV